MAPPLQGATESMGVQDTNSVNRPALASLSVIPAFTPPLQITMAFTQVSRVDCVCIFKTKMFSWNFRPVIFGGFQQTFLIYMDEGETRFNDPVRVNSDYTFTINHVVINADLNHNAIVLQTDASPGTYHLAHHQHHLCPCHQHLLPMYHLFQHLLPKESHPTGILSLASPTSQRILREN